MSSSDSDVEMYPVEFSVNEDIMMNYIDPHSFSGITKAIILGDLTAVKCLVKKGKSVNICDNRGNTPLHVAAITDKLDIVDYLLHLTTIRIDAENHQMQTPLFVSCKCRNTEIAFKLIEAGADVNICSNNFVTPLHLSVYSVELVERLIQHGAIIDTKDYSGDTPLNETVKDGTYEAASALLYYGADSNLACDYGITPFMHSLIGMKNEMQELLLNYEIDFNRETNENMSILFLAITGLSPYLLDIINRGADVNCAFDGVYNALYLSLNYSNFDTFKIIWEHCNYEKVWLCQSSNIINFILVGEDININKSDYLELIINSNKLGQVISSTVECDIIYNLVQYFHGTQLEKLSSFVYLLCSEGYSPLFYEVQELFYFYGYCSIFKFLLFVNDSKENIRTLDDNLLCNNELSFIICHTFLNLTSELSRESLFSVLKYSNFVPERVTKNLKNLMRFFSCPSNIYTKHSEFLNSLSDDDQINTGVPSLLELARNSTRYAIYAEKKYNINSCSSFYTILNRLDIFSGYKKIIALENSIY